MEGNHRVEFPTVLLQIQADSFYSLHPEIELDPLAASIPQTGNGSTLPIHITDSR